MAAHPAAPVPHDRDPVGDDALREAGGVLLLASFVAAFLGLVIALSTQFEAAWIGSSIRCWTLYAMPVAVLGWRLESRPSDALLGALRGGRGSRSTMRARVGEADARSASGGARVARVHDLNASGQDTLEAYIREYPRIQQVAMMEAWLRENRPGTFHFTGLVDPSDATVITPQATVDYGYNWFSLSDGPAIIRTPSYDRFFSVSVFDMLHNVPAVIAGPRRPILLIRPGQVVPDGDFDVVELETDQGLAFTRMVVVDNLDEVRALSAEITMEGGDGDMRHPVQRFSPKVEQAGQALIAAAIPHVDPDRAFGKTSGDVGDISRAAAVMLGQLGTPSDTVRYLAILGDSDGAALTATDTYLLTVPADIVHADGYFSITVYGADNKLLIPNDLRIYDRTTYSAEPEADGTYRITLSPDGSGKNGIPTGKPFYAILRAYVPIAGADMTVHVERQ